MEPLEEKIRDVKDRPILRTALAWNMDIIVTGDKDFLEADLDYHLVITPSEFLAFNTLPDTDGYVNEPESKYNRG